MDSMKVSSTACKQNRIIFMQTHPIQLYFHSIPVRKPEESSSSPFKRDCKTQVKNIFFKKERHSHTCFTKQNTCVGKKRHKVKEVRKGLRSMLSC